MSWPALQWAFDCDKTQSSAERLVLLEYANHADHRGYTWPSTEFIASVCHLHRDTVAEAIKALLVRRLIYETKKRRGTTRQVKVYRMPKFTYESHLKTSTFSKGQSVAKAPGKVGRSHLRLGTNLDPDNREPNISDIKALGNSLAECVNKLPAKESISFSGSYQNQIKFPEFASWCEKKGGKPTEAGFWKWMLGQKPHWVNKAAPKPEEESGYVLEGKFYSKEAANRLGIANADLIVKFQPAVRRNGKVLKPDAAALKA